MSIAEGVICVIYRSSRNNNFFSSFDLIRESTSIDLDTERSLIRVEEYLRRCSGLVHLQVGSLLESFTQKGGLRRASHLIRGASLSDIRIPEEIPVDETWHLMQT